MRAGAVLLSRQRTTSHFKRVDFKEKTKESTWQAAA
jgi:hypothetical protein